VEAPVPSVERENIVAEIDGEVAVVEIVQVVARLERAFVFGMVESIGNISTLWWRAPPSWPPSS